MSAEAQVLILRKAGATAITLPGRITRFPAKWGAWKAACLQLTRESRRDDGPVEAEVCIRLPKQDAEVFNRNQLPRVLEAARQHIWGSPVYLVVDPTAWCHHAADHPLAACRDWFEAAHAGGVVDILELPELTRAAGVASPGALPKDKTDLDPYDLRTAINVSTGRWDQLGRMAPAGPWRIVMPAGNDPSLESFLRSVATPASATCSNLLVVSSHSREGLLRSRRDRSVLQEFENQLPEPCMLATVGDHPSPKVSKFCDSRAIPRTHWGGRFQLAFALHRLHTAYGPASASSLARVEPVVVSSPRKFAGTWPGDPPFILITSAFCPDQESGRCLLAARYVERALHEAPRPVAYAVHPALEPEGLQQLIDAHRRVLAWVHIGHGDPSGALKGVHCGSVDAQRWLACFDGVCEYLGLVLLSACHSASVAACLAKAGAGVAIGFASEVRGLDCRLLVREVVHAALQSRGDRDTILKAFRMACNKPFGVSGRRFVAADPVAYYSQG